MSERKVFELWLDESGSFEKDNKIKKKEIKPSLIGGILFERNKFGKNAANKIIPEGDVWHSTETHDKELQFDKFKMLVESPVTLIIFNNEERIFVLNDEITYLNIIANGISQLLNDLLTRYDDVFLDIHIANRRRSTCSKIAKTEEYIKRLKEKIMLECLEQNNDSRLYNSWNISNGSATKIVKLMLADIVCNTYLTRETKLKMHSEYINQVFEDKEKSIKYSVFTSSLSKYFIQLLIENRVGEALILLCQSNNSTFVETSISKVFDVLNNMYGNEIDLQNKYITTTVECYLNHNNKFDECENLIINLLNYYIPILKQLDEKKGTNRAEKLQFDIKFYLLTLYTHEGKVKEATQIELECDNEIKRLPYNADMLSYNVKYQNRKIINKINSFAYDEAIKSCNKLIEQCEGIKTAMELVAGEERIHYDQLAKALGTKTQLLTLLLRNNPKYYAEAIECSNSAIKEFDSKDDICRQYLYRVQLETEYGKYDSALEYLAKAVGLENNNIKDVFEHVIKGSDFNLMAYIRLMAESKISNIDWDKADEMYSVLNKSTIMNKYKSGNLSYHPVEIILWKYATYLYNANSKKAATEYYDTAIKICFDSNELTLYIIGMAILLEKLAYVLRDEGKAKNEMKDLKRYYKKIQEIDMPESMRNIYKDLNLDLDEPDWNYYLKESRKITY